MWITPKLLQAFSIYFYRILIKVKGITSDVKNAVA